MRFPLNTLWLAASIVLTGISCSRGSYQLYEYMPYFPIDAIPGEVYIDDQVNAFHTGGLLPTDNPVYVDVRKDDGIRERGRLIQAADRKLVMSRGYKYAAPGDTTSVIEDEITIQKKHILILKVW